MFKEYLTSLVNAKMLEVCSTSLPQFAIPLIIGDPRYLEHLESRRSMFEARATEAWEILAKVDGTIVVKPQGAFYMTVLFEDGVLNNRQTLPIASPRVEEFIKNSVLGVAVDKRFVYYLLGATGICVVPLSGFCCDKQGFRVTLLETDDEKRRWTWLTIAENIKKYLASA